MRAVTSMLAVSALVLWGAFASAEAETSMPRPGIAAHSSELSSQQRRPRVRIYRDDDPRGVSPRYFPGSNAVRECSVAYVQEFRPSGTVIAPHMKCFWRRP